MAEDTNHYYDAFSENYETDRFGPYHSLIRELELGLILPRTGQKRVLDVGCGTGLILQELGKVAARAEGVDPSLGMLGVAKRRGFNVCEGSATSLPFPDASFDAVVCLKVLPHVRDIEAAMKEFVRVLKPGGQIFLEFYNPLSIRYIIKKCISRPTSAAYTEDDVFTRYDNLRTIKSYLDPHFSITHIRGIRIVIPHSGLLRFRFPYWLLSHFERFTCDTILGRLGGFLLVSGKKVS